MREPDRKHNLWQVESKGYEPKINLGMQLVFLLRANPIRAKRDNDNKQHRHDVIMEAKALLRKRGEHKSLPLLLQEEGSNWLLSRAERCGFNVKPGFLRVDGYQQHHFTKGKDNKQVSFSTLDFNGALIVTDPNLFLETLFKGIGPAKAFGCGLMLVKRI
jgi:CRISPR system Cascade subunit CasE